MHIVKIAWAAWLAIAAGLTGTATAQDHPLTCSVVQIQCLQECGKEAGPMICNRYCSGKMNECMRTGNWLGRYGDVFTNVLRQ